MSRFARIGCLCITLLTACGEGAVDEDVDYQGELGVCVLSDCPAPDDGFACCRPGGRCGRDPLGLGFECLANPGDPLTDNVCRVADCPLPTIGNSCCTPAGSCGFDPIGTGVACFANAVPDRRDAATPEPTCDIEECPYPEVGYSCCTPRGECGNDLWGNGFCLPNPPADAGTPAPACEVEDCPVSAVGDSCCTAFGVCGSDPWENGVCYANPVKRLGVPGCPLEDCPTPDVGAACCTNTGACGSDPFLQGICYPEQELPDAEVPDLTPPDDPSLTGECPTFIGITGHPVWGCCATVGAYGVCGTFNGDRCMLAAGTSLPTGPAPDADAGVVEPFLRCEPPAK